VHGKPIVALGAVYCGPLDAGDDVVGPLRTLADPVADLLGPVPYAAMQQMLDPLWQAGAYNYFTSAMNGRSSRPGGRGALCQVVGKAATPQSEISRPPRGWRVGARIYVKRRRSRSACRRISSM
jgi:hypothetical protein